MKVEKQSWEEFRKTGLLWWINRSLHLFGYSIVCKSDGFGNIVEAYPARTDYKGFEREDEEEGFEKLTNYIKNEL